MIFANNIHIRICSSEKLFATFCSVQLTFFLAKIGALVTVPQHNSKILSLKIKLVLPKKTHSSCFYPFLCIVELKVKAYPPSQVYVYTYN